MYHITLKTLLANLPLLFALTEAYGQSTDMATIYKEFSRVPDTTRTKVWWFHGETPTTKEGITLDLEAFKRAGIGGVVYYDQVHGPGRLAQSVFSQEWWNMLVFASQEAKRLGLSFEANASNGFVAGGPWITLDKGMQKLVAVDTVVTCTHGLIDIALPRPQSLDGVYKDVAVMAVPYSETLLGNSRRLRPTVTCSDSTIDPMRLMGDGFQTIRYKDGQTLTVCFDFGRSFTARSISYNLKGRGISRTSSTNVPGRPSSSFVGTNFRVLPDLGQLEVSDDGIHYRFVCNLKPIYQDHRGARSKTLAFPAVCGRYYRIRLHDWKDPFKTADQLALGGITLSAAACVDQWEEKAGLYSEYSDGEDTPHYSPDEILRLDHIADVTPDVHDGRLSWTCGEGSWLIMRFCQVPTGAKIKHGRTGMDGLECDKLSVSAATSQYRHYFSAIKDTLLAHGGRIDGMTMDSHEGGAQNWTDDFAQAFDSLRGYSLLPYLPVMAGHVVEETNTSAEVLYDVRRTISDLMVSRYYGTLARLCRQDSVGFTAQAVGNALCITADQIEAKKVVDKPQGEFWAIHPDGNYDIKDCSSAAHVYAKPIASGEAFTDATYRHSLARLKRLADQAYCLGINEFVVCASPHQPWRDSIPGNTAGTRQYALNRSNTYWPYSRSFWDYQSRCAYMLRQGKAVQDLCVYLGDDVPMKILTYRLPDIPQGYDFDAFTTDALLHRFAMADGRLSLPDGKRYSLMVLPRDGALTYAALLKLSQLVADGAVIYGPMPHLVSGKTNVDQGAAFNRLARAMWGSHAAGRAQGSHRYGRGRVCWGYPLGQVLARLGQQPDVRSQGTLQPLFTHRAMAGADVYFVMNPHQEDLQSAVAFRTLKRHAALWDPLSGQRVRIADGEVARNGAATTIPIRLKAGEALFVVFSSRPADVPCQAASPREVKKIGGPWHITFDRAWGGPLPFVSDSLFDWTESPCDSVRHYSGLARYTTTFRLDSTISHERETFLLFAPFNGLASVRLNGQEVGVVWCSPWLLDVTGLLRAGDNVLEVGVVNSLTNRLIGDAALPPDRRLTRSTGPIASPRDPLEPSGMAEAPTIVVAR